MGCTGCTKKNSILSKISTFTYLPASLFRYVVSDHLTWGDCWNKMNGEFHMLWLCYHTIKIHCSSSLGNLNAIHRFFGFTSAGFALSSSKCTFIQIPVLVLCTPLISPTLPFMWDAITNPWQNMGQLLLGTMRSLPTWNILSPLICLGSAMGPVTTQISPSFLYHRAWNNLLIWIWGITPI